MKKVFCITIALCLVFASVLPVYAEAWTSQQASNTTQSVIGILSMLTQFRTDFMNWATLTQSGSQGLGFTFQDIAVTLAHIDNWFAPAGSNTMGGSFVELVANIGTIVSTYMPSLPAIESYVASWMSSNNSLLTQLRNALYNSFDIVSASTAEDRWKQTAHYLLGDSQDVGYPYSWYPYEMTLSDGQTYSQGIPWNGGTPLGNIALMMKYFNLNETNRFRFYQSAILKHYNDQLSTWDSQGSTLSQVLFTPESAIQGLYRYLAFTQRDVARLAYVFANDEELETRELAQANQKQVLDDFIDPNGSGSVSTTDLGNMTVASDGFKSNFSTNVGSSHIWDVFDNSRYNWFTQQTKNQLDTTPQTRSLKAVQNDYPTPLLDNYYNEIFGIIGVDVND